jgi:hypothetical protein
LVCESAAKNGYLNCLIYAHVNGCSWDERTCISAARNGHLDCLQYAIENGCRWNKNEHKISSYYNKNYFKFD